MKHKLLTNNYKLFGAISGDVIGSSYEFMGNKVYDFDLFTPGMDYTDDTILTIAVAIAEAFYGEVPLFIKERVIDLLPEDFLRVIVKFNEECRKH